MCAVVVVIYTVCKSMRLLIIICSYELIRFQCKAIYQLKPHVFHWHVTAGVRSQIGLNCWT
jgi:hypothetical protein